MASLHRIVPCLWYDGVAEDAAIFYTGIFPNSRITTVMRYPKSAHPAHATLEGKVMVAAFELDGQAFTALNGGPQFTFSEAISLQVLCEDQAEIDYYWSRLSEGGDPKAQRCGWLKDQFGVSWQVTPRNMGEFFGSDAATSQRVMAAMLPMTKLDVAALRRARDGQ